MNAMGIITTVGDEDDVLRHSFGRGVNVSHAEALVGRLAEDDPPARVVELDFSSCRHVDSGAGWRIGNAIRRHGSAGLLRTIVPDLSTRGRHVFDVFVRSGLGLAVARHASEIRTADGVDAAPEFREKYDVEHERVAQNFVIVTNLDQGAVNIDDLDDFSVQFKAWLPKVNARAEWFDSYDRTSTAQEGLKDLSSLKALASLAFESIQNVYDHAARRPFRQDVRVLTYFSIVYRMHWAGAKGDSGGFRRFYERARAYLGSHQFGGLEITVLDDGCGIAARFAQNAEIYRSSPQQERDATLAALRFGASSKLETLDSPIRGDPGFGSSNIAQSLKRLRAYAALRTGRLLVTCDGTKDGPAEFELSPQEESFLPGTVLTLAVPIPLPQLDLPFGT